MTRRCEACDQEFQAKRADARFCSARCRMRAFRARSVTPAVTAVTSVSEKKSPKGRIDWKKSIETARATRRYYDPWR